MLDGIGLTLDLVKICLKNFPIWNIKLIIKLARTVCLGESQSKTRFCFVLFCFVLFIFFSRKMSHVVFLIFKFFLLKILYVFWNIMTAYSYETSRKTTTSLYFSAIHVEVRCFFYVRFCSCPARLQLTEWDDLPKVVGDVAKSLWRTGIVLKH